jgi:hypothetical protein
MLHHWITIDGQCEMDQVMPRWEQLLLALATAWQSGSARSCKLGQPYSVAKPSQVGIDVDGTSCSLRHPLLVGVSLVYRVFSSASFFLAWSPSLSLVDLPLWTHTLRLSGWGLELLDQRCLI